MTIQKTISNVVLQLEQMYVLLNEHYFKSELPRVKILITNNNRTKATIITFDGNCDGIYQISIDERNLDCAMSKIATDMLHAMVHIYDIEHGIKDTSGAGNSYHNKRFKAIAEAHGLVAERSHKYGWDVLRPSSELIDYIELQGWRSIQDRNHIPSNSSVKFQNKPSSTRKYFCPKCGTIVRATKFVNLICGDCSVPMQIDMNYFKVNKAARQKYKKHMEVVQ